MNRLRRRITRGTKLVLSILVGLVVALGLAGLVLPQPALAQATTTTTNIEVPFAITVFIPCALGGVGEVLAISGPLHVLITETIDAAGGTHLGLHFQPKGISGLGLVSGDKYRGTGITRQHINTSALPPFNFTFVNNFRMIGQGSGNNLLVHDTIHLTVNANGDVTADIVKTSVDCK